MQKRNIGLSLVLSFVTCGIYSIYWLVMLTDETNELARPEKETTGVAVFLLTLITCGIYGLYWAYQMGKNLDIAASQNGLMAEDRSVIYLILQIILPIANLILMQSTVNNILDASGRI